MITKKGRNAKRLFFSIYKALFGLENVCTPTTSSASVPVHDIVKAKE